MELNNCFHTIGIKTSTPW